MVVATQGKRDEEGLEAALATGSPYIAFIASERKAEKLRNYLKERGHDSARVDALVSPAGIEIGAVTPEEIALSVLAGLVKARREQAIDTTATGATSETASSCCSGKASTPATASSADTQSSAVDPVCGMHVEIASAEYTSDYQGQTYYFCCAGCQHSFEKTPEQYLSAMEQSG